MTRKDDEELHLGVALRHDAVLDSLRAFHQEYVRREKGLVLLAIQWVKLNPGAVEEVADRHSNAPIATDDPNELMWYELAAKGCPRMDDLAIPMFAQAAGLSEYQARKLIRQSVMLVYLLPRVCKRALAGDVEMWRARILADECWDLTPGAVDYVDRLMSLSNARHTQIGRQNVLKEAQLRYMADQVAKEEEAAKEQRCFEICFDQEEHGKVPVWGILDLADALELEQAITQGAKTLKEKGSDDPLHVRRAWAVGDVARNARESDPDSFTSSGKSGKSQTIMYIHLDGGAFTDQDSAHAPTGAQVARIEGPGIPRATVLDANVVKEWFNRPRNSPSSHVSIRPVVELDVNHHDEAYQIPNRLKEQVNLRDGTCVFPWCTRVARSCDADHMIPWKPDGRGGPTCGCNLAPLCRFHHRAKTHADNHKGNSYTWWNYESLGEGKYLWRGPKGTTLLRTNARVHHVAGSVPNADAPLSTRIEEAQKVVERIEALSPQPPADEDNTDLVSPKSAAPKRRPWHEITDVYDAATRSIHGPTTQPSALEKAWEAYEERCELFSFGEAPPF